MQIFVKTLNGPVHSVVCQEDDTILTVKQSLESKYEDGMPPSQQRLLYAGKQLDDTRTLKDYNIFHNSTIHIVLRLRGGMQIFVKTLNGPVHSVVCQEDDTIMTVKQALESKYEDGMPPSQQRLLYAGKQLDDTRTLKDYNIFHNSTIHIVLRLRGGNYCELL